MEKQKIIPVSREMVVEKSLFEQASDAASGLAESAKGVSVEGVLDKAKSFELPKLPKLPF